MIEDLKVDEGKSMSADQGEHRYKYFLPKIYTGKIPYAEHARRSSDRQLPLRPKQVVYCKRCVVSNQRPRITFDEKGICSACDYAEYKKTQVDWPKRKKMFKELCDQYRRNDGRYDVLVPCSGGKDSGSLAHRLKYEYGMHPLCVTCAPLLYTNIGMQNFQNMTLSGLDSYLFTPDRIVQRKLSTLFFVRQGDHFESFSRGTMGFPFHVALKEGIKLIMYGENGELEYGGDTDIRDIPYDRFDKFDRHYGKHVAFREVVKFGHENGYLNDEDIKSPSLKYHMLPPVEEIKKAGIEARWYGWYFSWVPKENYYYAAEHYEFEAMPRRTEATYSKYASLDDLTDPFHFYMALIKFGIARATSDAAHEIRDGHITREEGVALVHRYDQEFPSKYFKDYLRYIDISEEEFWGVVDVYRSLSPHLWEKVNGEWRLKVQVS